MQNCSEWSIPEHGNVLQSHLTGSVLADADTAVRSNNIEVGLGDDTHAQVVKSTGQEGSKGGGKCNRPKTISKLISLKHDADRYSPISASDSDAHPKHILFTDEALNVAVLVDLEHLLGEGGVLHVTVQGDNIWMSSGKLAQSTAIGLSGGKLLA